MNFYSKKENRIPLLFPEDNRSPLNAAYSFFQTTSIVCDAFAGFPSLPPRYQRGWSSYRLFPRLAAERFRLPLLRDSCRVSCVPPDRRLPLPAFFFLRRSVRMRTARIISSRITAAPAIPATRNPIGALPHTSRICRIRLLSRLPDSVLLPAEAERSDPALVCVSFTAAVPTVRPA